MYADLCGNSYWSLLLCGGRLIAGFDADSHKITRTLSSSGGKLLRDDEPQPRGRHGVPLPQKREQQSWCGLRSLYWLRSCNRMGAFRECGEDGFHLWKS